MEEIRIGPKRKLRTYYQSHESLAPESKFSKKSELNSKQESESTHSPDNPMKPKIKLQFSDKNQSSIKPVFKIPKNSEAPSLRKPLTPLAKLSPTVKKLPIRVNIVGGKQKAVPAAPPPPPASLLQNPETANVVLNGDRATLMGDIRKFGQTILKPKTPNNNPEEDSFKQQIHARRRGISSSTDDDENQENVVSNNNNDVSVLSPIDRVKQMPKLLNSNASSKNPSDDEDWK
uniref:WH2 domain-containing protein n=1 Tax=Acrobeloides nanus TaxID=290746 RepID=A0A914C805_9BILA